MCMFVSEICAEGVLCLFPGDWKIWKVGKKYPFFSHEHHFEIDLQRRKLHFLEQNDLTTQKRPNFACDNCDIFP